MSLQVHCFRTCDNPSASGTEYGSPINGQLWTATEHNGSVIVTAPGTFSNWKIVLPTAPGSGKSFTFTLRKNTSDTAAVITIANTATSGTYTATTIALADGDVLTIKCVPSGTPTSSTPIIAWDFNSTTAGQSIYGAGNDAGTIAVSRETALYFHVDESNWGDLSGTGQLNEVVACAGTLTKLTVKLSAAQGASNGYVFTIYKNGTAQDGTGGTPDTRITFGGADVTLSSTFSLAVAAGDYVMLRATIVNTPSTKPIFGLTLTATNPGESQFGACYALGGSNANVNNYNRIGAGATVAWTTTEADHAATLGLTGMKLSNLYVRLNTGIVSGGSYTLTLMKNGSATALAATVVGNTAPANIQMGDTTHQVTLQAGDTFSMLDLSSGSPANRRLRVSAVQNSIGGRGGGGGSSAGGNKKGGGGSISIQTTGGAGLVNFNLGIDIGITS